MSSFEEFIANLERAKNIIFDSMAGASLAKDGLNTATGILVTAAHESGHDSIRNAIAACAQAHTKYQEAQVASVAAMAELETYLGGI